MGDDADEVLLRFALEHPLPGPGDVEAFCALHPRLAEEIRDHAAMRLLQALDPALGTVPDDAVAEAAVRREAEVEARAIIAGLRRDLGVTPVRRTRTRLRGTFRER